MAKRRFRKVDVWKDDDSPIEFRLIPYELAKERDAIAQHLTSTEDDENDKDALQSNHPDMNQRERSTTTARRRLKEKARQQKQYLKQMFKPSTRSTSAVPTASASELDTLQSVRSAPVHSICSAPALVQSTDRTPSKPEVNKPVHRTQSDIFRYKLSSAQPAVNIPEEMSADASSASIQPISSETKHGSMLGALPLQHERALLAKPSKKTSRLMTGRLTPDLQNGVAESTGINLQENHAINTVTSMDSLLVGTKIKGNVLVLQAHSGEEAVEAVSLKPEKKTAKDESSYVSYTQRLLQEDSHDDGSSESSIESEETSNSSQEEASLEATDQSFVESATPLFMNTNGEISNLQDSLEHTRPSSLVVQDQQDRYAVLPRNNIRVKSDPLVVSRPKSLSMARSTTSCFTGPVPLEEPDMKEDDGDGMMSLEREFGSFTCRQEYISSQEAHLDGSSTRSNSNAGLARTSCKPTTLLQEPVDDCSDVSEWGFRRAPSHSRSRSELSGLLDREQSNISAASMFSEDIYHALKSRYSSFESSTSVSTEMRKPINMPVRDEFRDMAEELKKNPVIVMKWLNPL